MRILKKAAPLKPMCRRIVESIRASANLNLRGLMTVPPWSEDAELSRPYFARLAAIAARHGIEGLSMEHVARS